MKFFKQTKETKRKISFFMALAMIISLLPVSPVVKAASSDANTKDCNVYIVNNCSTYVKVSDTLTGNAIKAGSEATTSAVIKVKPENNYKIGAVSNASVNISQSDTVLGGLTVTDKSGNVVTGVSITVKSVTAEPSNITTSCAISSSAISKISIKEAAEGNATYAAITVDGANSDVEITLSYKKAETGETTVTHEVTFKQHISNASIKAKARLDGKETALDTIANGGVLSVTSGSIIDITLTPGDKHIFKQEPTVKADGNILNKSGSGYNYSTNAITKDIEIEIEANAELEESSGEVKYQIGFDSTGLKNAKAVAEVNKTAFTGGELAAEEIVSITVTPDNGYVFTNKEQVLIEASGATTTGALEDDGSFTATVTGFTKAATIKVSGEAVKSSLETDNSNKDTNIGKAELDVDTATLESNKEQLIAAFGVASESAIREILDNGGRISVSLKVDKVDKISDADKELLKENKITDAELEKGIVLNIKLIATCYKANNEEYASADVGTLSKDVTIKMSVKGLVEAVKQGYSRKYYIIRIHNNEVKKWECPYASETDKDNILIKSNLFSTYVLTYEDKKEGTDPGNPDNPSKPSNPGGPGSYIPSSSTATPAPSATPSATPDASATPAASTEPGASAVPSASPSGTEEPGTDVKPDPTKAPGNNNGDNDKDTGNNAVKVKVGKKVTVNSSKYKVTSVSGTRAVQFTSGKKNAKNVVIPSTVKISGKNYKVTSIANNAFKNNKKLKKVTIGVNVNKIGKAAFKGCKNLKSIIIKTNKLTAKKVGANAFKGINKKATFKVPKKKVKAYKKIVKAKGAAKTVKVKK